MRTQKVPIHPAVINILYKNQKFIREKERMLKMFLGHNTQKTYRIIV